MNGRLGVIQRDITVALNVVQPARPTPAALAQPVPKAAAPSASGAKGRASFYRAVEVLGRGQVNEARRLLRDFLNAHPNDAAAPHARYWLGETYFAGGDYTAAGWIFAEAYEKDMKGPMAADNLTRLGMALSQLEKQQLACATFDKLQGDFPRGAYQADLVGRQRAAAGCR
jgi:tol-pal system protein YbgF